MMKFVLAMMMTVLAGQFASAGCNPCICGYGGGLPPPPECPNAGKWKKHSAVPQENFGILESLLSDKNVEQEILSAGGLEEVTYESKNGKFRFQLKTLNGAQYSTPSL